MDGTGSGQQPDPMRIFEALGGYQLTAAMRAAIELDIFTAVGEGNTTPDTLAKRCGANERGVRILCDYLVIHQFLTKQGSDYGPTSESALFLDRKSPACVGSVSNFIGAPDMVDAFKNLAGAVRKGGTLLGDEGAVSDENPVWVEFARSMPPVTTRPAEIIARLLGADSGEPWKVLDIAAGHGIFGITVAVLNPNAQIVGLDWKNVLEVAKENARKRGVEDRYKTLPGSAFTVEFGKAYDLVLLTNFLHHFDPETNGKLLRKIHAALRTGGRVATLEFVPNEDRVSPPGAAAFSLTMLGMTPQGDAYTYRELEAMFMGAGFSRCELHALPPTAQSLVVTYK